MANEIRKYELMIIVKALLPDDVRGKAIDYVKQKVSDLGGNVKKEDVWGKKYLAYKIKGHNEGYYVLFTIELPADKANELNNEIRLQSDILRFLLINAKDAGIESEEDKQSSVIAFDQEIEDIDEDES